MKELRKKSFKNGVVYCLQLEDGFVGKKDHRITKAMSLTKKK